MGIAGIALLDWLAYDGWLAISWKASVFGALFAGGFFAVAALVAWAIRGAEALGQGDVKLVAMIGAFLGPMPGGMLVMMMASVMGSVVGIAASLLTGSRPWVPFGPALAVAAVIYILVGDAVVELFFPGMIAFYGA